MARIEQDDHQVQDIAGYWVSWRGRLASEPQQKYKQVAQLLLVELRRRTCVTVPGEQLFNRR